MPSDTIAVNLLPVGSLLSPPCPTHSQAAASPGFLESITLVNLSPRPPLLIDPGLEAPPVLKALQGLARERTAQLHGSPGAAAAAAAAAMIGLGGKSVAGSKGVTGRAFFTIYDDDLPSRVRERAVVWSLPGWCQTPCGNKQHWDLACYDAAV
jgi:hypothetical protein